MINIGIDPSINSTGVCIWDDNKDTHKYYLISSKMTKKMQEFDNKYVKLISYEKRDVKQKDYSVKETLKFENLFDICTIIKDILKTYKNKDIHVNIEGISYGSTGSAALVDLSFLNAIIRYQLKLLNIPFTIISPTSLKKFACANGQAEKDVMIDAWKRMDNNIKNISILKIDDLADSYFLAHYE